MYEHDQWMKYSVKSKTQTKFAMQCPQKVLSNAIEQKRICQRHPFLNIWIVRMDCCQIVLGVLKIKQNLIIKKKQLQFGFHKIILCML